jgi:prepilin-type N-terminal cleavage/methylation domain-containing protein
MKMTLSPQHRGFTLIELLVVITVIGVLSTIGLVGFKSIRKQQTTKLALVDVNKLHESIQSYKDINLVSIVNGKDKDGIKIVNDPKFPENKEIMKGLTQPNANGFTVIEGIAISRYDANGNYLDPWKTPYIFKSIMKKDDPLKRVVDVYPFSAGPNLLEQVSTGPEWNSETVLPPEAVIPEDDNDNVYPIK